MFSRAATGRKSTQLSPSFSRNQTVQIKSHIQSEFGSSSCEGKHLAPCTLTRGLLAFHVPFAITFGEIPSPFVHRFTTRIRLQTAASTSPSGCRNHRHVPRRNSRVLLDLDLDDAGDLSLILPSLHCAVAPPLPSFIAVRRRGPRVHASSHHPPPPPSSSSVGAVALDLLQELWSEATQISGVRFASAALSSLRFATSVGKANGELRHQSPRRARPPSHGAAALRERLVEGAHARASSNRWTTGGDESRTAKRRFSQIWENMELAISTLIV